MITEKIKSNEVLHPIARAIKKVALKGWITSCCSFKPRKRIEIEKYEGIHKGKRCFIVATGPSLTLDDLETIRDEYSFSMNSIINLYDRTNYRPTYYMIQDGNVERKLRQKLLMSDHKKSFMGISDVSGFRAVITKKQAERYNGQFEFYNLNIAYHMFDMCYSEDDHILTKFSSDCAAGIFDGCTVTYSAIQMACYMGFDEIYLLGCDTNHAGHVDDNSNQNKKAANDTLYALIHAYEVAKEYADEHGIKIYNATRGGMLEVFPRVDFDTLFLNRKVFE